MRSGTRRAVIFAPVKVAAVEPPAMFRNVEAPEALRFVASEPAAGDEPAAIQENGSMAAHADLKTRLDAVGVSAEIYSGDPPALVKKIAALCAAGNYPVALNCKGAKTDDVLILMPLRAFEHSQPRTGFEGDD